MESKTCPGCGKKFAWYLFRLRKTCSKCKTSVCVDCLEANAWEELVCPSCHVCTNCGAETAKNGLKILGDESVCPACHERFKSLLPQWVGGTRYEYLRDARIVQTLGQVFVFTQCDSPAQVQDLLKIKTLLSGGNAYINFFWKRESQHHEQTYRAGTGRAGNPYYRTSRWTSQHFTGQAEAVVAEQKSHNSLGRRGLTVKVTRSKGS